MPVDPNARIDPDVRDIIDALEQQLLDANAAMEVRLAALEAMSAPAETVEISFKKSDDTVDTFSKV